MSQAAFEKLLEFLQENGVDFQLKRVLMVFVAEFRVFFLFLKQQKRNAISFIGLSLAFAFFPAQGYYQTLQLNWHRPQVAAAHFVLPPPSVYPQNIKGTKPPVLTAKGTLVLDLASSVSLYEKNPNLRLLPASTTKIATALIALEAFRFDEILMVPKLVKEGQTINLSEGEQLTVESLLYALLVHSANDAAETLAANFPQGRQAFVDQMNEKVKSLHLIDTHYVNPTGIDEDGQFTSAFDLAMLGKYAMANPAFARIVATSVTNIKSIDGKKEYKLENVNQLLGKIAGLKGIKTGWTENAGECLVSYVERNGHTIIIVVLDSKDRFGETAKLIDWTFDNFDWVVPHLDS